MNSPIKELLVKLNQVVRPNMGNALFALFLTLICETIFGMILAAPAMLLISRNEGTNQMIFAYMLFFCALIVWLLFQYGFHILILRMVRHEYVTLGYVFFGFKKIKKVLPLILTIAVMLAALTVAIVAGGRIALAKSGIAASLAKGAEAVAENPDLTDRLFKGAGILLAVYAILFVIIFIRFAFVFYLHFDNPDDGLLSLFKKSARLMKKNCFRLIHLMLTAGGRNLLTAIAIFILSSVMANGKKAGGGGGLSILLLLLNFIYFINAYTAILKMYFALPVLYTDALQPNVEVTITDDENSQVLADTALLLAGKGDVEQDSADEDPSADKDTSADGE